jgi:hypothetical protein
MFYGTGNENDMFLRQLTANEMRYNGSVISAI